MPIASLPGAKIAYCDHNASANSDAKQDKIPILLVHGFSSSIKDNWLDTHWIKFLSELGLRVIAFDNRGHGNSEKFYNSQDYHLSAMVEDAVQLLDYLNIPKVHLMGYSMGARISALLTITHPGRVAKLVLGGNGYGMIEGTGDWTPVRDGLLAASMDDVTDLRARAFRRFAERTGSDRQALAACVMGLRQLFTPQDFQKITHDVLVAIGTEDDIAGSGEKLANLMTNARHFPIPGRDHMRASTDKLFMGEVAQFIK